MNVGFVTATDSRNRVARCVSDAAGSALQSAPMAELDLNREQTLAEIPMFAELDAVGLWQVASVATEVTLDAGYVLMQPGQEGSGLFVILDGTVIVELPGAHHIECGPGEFLGELSLLVDGLMHTSRVRALSTVRCLAINRDDFEELLRDNPKIAVGMLAILARRLAETDRLLEARK